MKAPRLTGPMLSALRYVQKMTKLDEAYAKDVTWEKVYPGAWEGTPPFTHRRAGRLFARGLIDLVVEEPGHDPRRKYRLSKEGAAVLSEAS